MRLVVLGDPVAHSLSPTLHEAALREVGIPGSYGTRCVDEAGMEDAVAQMRAGELDGASVTMPHKRVAARLADGLDPSAERTGAVNALVRVGTSVFGHNTDIDGITWAWRQAGLPTAGPVTLVGAGGAAAAALVALSSGPDGIRRTPDDISVVARRRSTAQDLVTSTGVGARVVDWADGHGGGVVVNATPIGMCGDEFPSHLLDGVTGVFDMAYGTVTTPLVAHARSAKVPVAEGPDMLLGQALAAFRLWTGHPAPAVVMRQALDTERALRRGTR